MALAYLPGNLALIVGPTIGSVVATGALFAVFPIVAGVSAIGVATLIIAARQVRAPVKATVVG